MKKNNSNDETKLKNVTDFIPWGPDEKLRERWVENVAYGTKQVRMYILHSSTYYVVCGSLLEKIVSVSTYFYVIPWDLDTMVLG